MNDRNVKYAKKIKTETPSDIPIISLAVSMSLTLRYKSVSTMTSDGKSTIKQWKNKTGNYVLGGTTTHNQIPASADLLVIITIKIDVF